MHFQPTSHSAELQSFPGKAGKLFLLAHFVSCKDYIYDVYLVAVTL